MHPKLHTLLDHGQNVEKPQDVRSALKNAIKENNEGIPAVIDFVIDPFDVPDGFKEFSRDVRGIPI